MNTRCCQWRAKASRIVASKRVLREHYIAATATSAKNSAAR
jgi:hypothetical protein